MRLVTVTVLLLVGLVAQAENVEQAPSPGVDLLQFAREFVAVAYLRPLGLSEAQLRIETESFPAGGAPLCVDVRIITEGKSHRDGSVSVCLVGGRVWFAAADQAFVEFYSRAPLSEAVREERLAVISEYLTKVAGASGFEPRKSAKKGYFSREFKVPVTQFTPWGTASAVFNSRSGLLGVFGTPFPAEAR